MATKNDTKWYQNYDDLKAYIDERGHLPDKHVVENRALLSWAKYQRKKIKERTLDAEKRELFESLLASRSNEHTGGRKEMDNEEQLVKTKAPPTSRRRGTSLKTHLLLAPFPRLLTEGTSCNALGATAVATILENLRSCRSYLG